MTSRSTLLLVALLLLGSLASAAPASTGSAVTAASLPFCVADLAAPELPSFGQKPTTASGYICGACSVAVCAGRAGGQPCSANGVCIDPYGVNTCPEDNDPICKCWFGQLP
jgi:hypothetical protein